MVIKERNATMKVADLDLRFDMGKQIKIVKIVNTDNRKFEGSVGDITNPFGEFGVEDIGIFLQETKFNADVINLNKDDEVEFIDEK
jgi:hypothetical protein